MAYRKGYLKKIAFEQLLKGKMVLIGQWKRENCSCREKKSTCKWKEKSKYEIIMILRPK